MSYRTPNVRKPGYVAGMSDFTIKSLTPETFDDFAALVERNKGMFASCWCTHFHPDCAEKGQTAEGNRALKQRLVADGIAHAALVYDGDRAVAWAEYGSPEELPSIQHRKEYLATAERLPDYRVTCILVERDHRGQGLAAIALRGAVGLIAQAGGGRVEGYPHLQRHPHDVRARGLHLRPAQGPGQLRDGARGGPGHARLKRSSSPRGDSQAALKMSTSLQKSRPLVSVRPVDSRITLKSRSTSSSGSPGVPL
jgi:hypothetical protein